MHRSRLVPRSPGQRAVSWCLDPIRILAVVIVAAGGPGALRATAGQAVVPAPEGRDGPGDSAAAAADDPLALLDGLERQRLTVAWDEQPLLRIVTELESVHGIPVSVDWTSLDAIGVDRRTEMTLRATNASALAVLEQLAVLAGDEFDRAVVEAWGGRALLTTDAIARRLQITRAYDVRELLASPEVARGLEVWMDGEAGDDADGGPGDDGGDAEDRDPGAEPEAGGEAAPARPAGPAPAFPIGGRGFSDSAPSSGVPGGPAERLLRTLLEHSDPEAWFRVGGDGARVTERGGLLLVSAPASTHRLLRGAIASLRALDPSGIRLVARLVRVVPETVDRLGRRHAPSSVAFVRRLIESPDSEVLWTSRTSVARDATLAIEDRTAAGRLDLRLVPRWDAERGRFVVSITAGLRRDGAAGAERNGIETEVPLDLRGGAIALDLPSGGSASGGSLMLVLLPAGL